MTRSAHDSALVFAAKSSVFLPNKDRTARKFATLKIYHRAITLLALLAVILTLLRVFFGWRGVQGAGALLVVLVLAWACVGLLDAFWLIFGLLLEKTFPYLNFLPFDPASRWSMRHPTLRSLCISTIPAVEEGVVLGYAAFLGGGAVSPGKRLAITTVDEPL
jgi:hypothetical protein